MAVDTRLSSRKSSTAPSAKTDGAAAPRPLKRVARSLPEIADVFARLAREKRAPRETVSALTDKGSSQLEVRLAQSKATGGPESQEVNPSKLLVWAKENRLTSDGKTAEVSLERTVHLSADGLKIELVHVSGSSVLSTVNGHQPFEADGKTVTQDAFDQVQALHTADTFLKRLSGFGIDLPSVYRDSSGNSGLVRIIANAMSEENAGYIPGSNVYVFGTSEGRFHLVSCKEILVHELAHGYFDHIAPGVNSDTKGEGKPMHEAMGDLFAALHFENPNISEDLGAYLAEKDGGKPGPLRSIANDLTLDPNVHQEHKRSLVYSGMVWAVTERLAKSVGLSKACDLMLGAVAKAPFFVTNKSPTPEECLRAFIDGARSHIGKSAPGQVDGIVNDLQQEAVKRKLIAAPLTLGDAPSEPAKFFESSFAGLKKSDDPSAFAGIARALPALCQRKDLGFEVLGDRRFGDVRRVTLRATVEDPSTRKMVAVEDGHLEVVMEGSRVCRFEGPALALPEKFDFTVRDGGDPRRSLSRAKRLVAEHLKQMAENDPSAATVRRGLPTLFNDANLTVRPILIEGVLRLEVITLAGEFIVDLEHNEVRTRRLMHVYDINEHAHIH